MRKFQITLSEYNRIHQVAHGVLDNVANVEKACIFFACFGAMVLNKHYKIPARPVAGGFALCVGNTPDIAFFGKKNDNRIETALDGFHMWVQTETHIIDFMAPIFPEVFSQVELPIVPRQMLQRELTTEASKVDGLIKPGDFFTIPDANLTEHLTNSFLSCAQKRDLLMIANAWFGSSRGKQKKSFGMVNDLGEVYQLSLPKTIATGSW